MWKQHDQIGLGVRGKTDPGGDSLVRRCGPHGSGDLDDDQVTDLVDQDEDDRPRGRLVCGTKPRAPKVELGSEPEPELSQQRNQYSSLSDHAERGPDAEQPKLT